MKLVLVAGSTRTARIDGLSAAGATADLLAHTPAADIEILHHGRPTDAPVVPISPGGCPTPAVVTRAVVETTDLEPAAIDAGMARPAAVPTVSVGDRPGADIRSGPAVPNAAEVFERAREYGAGLGTDRNSRQETGGTADRETDRILVGETIPGGTTTAMAVLRALGERAAVSSSLPENPLALKESVVRAGLDSSDLDPGEAAGEPLRAVRAVGDPVLAAVAGVTVGALEAGIAVTLAGGTQLATAGAIVRHLGVDDSLTLASTSFVARDDTAALRTLAEDLDLDLVVTDPNFERGDHPAFDAYVAGEAKEGVGMGGALAHADRRGVAKATVRDRVTELVDGLLAQSPARGSQGGTGE